MATMQRLRRLLDANNVPYRLHRHRRAYTATAVAKADHVPLSEMAKVVLLRGRRRYLMAVIPASRRLDLPRLRSVTEQPDLELANEAELAQLFPDCETGAMPPFGNLFGIPVWVDDALGRESETVFNAGNHDETVHMRYADFVRLVKPSFGALAHPPDAARPLPAPDEEGC
jgi:Ala-tRNA(Pro) deacylase